MTVLDLTAHPSAPTSTAIEAVPLAALAADVRRWSLRAIALLSVLNVLDVVLTTTFVRAGLEEGNPLMRGLVQDWRLGAVKAIVLAALALKTWTAPPSVARACWLWLAVGVYLVVSYVNWEVIQQLPV